MERGFRQRTYFRCTCAVSEAMRQKCTRRLRTDYRHWVESFVWLKITVKCNMLLREPKTPNITMEHRTKLNGLSKFILCSNKSNHSRLQQKTVAVFACFYSQHFSCTWSIKNVIQVALFLKCLKTGKQIKGGFPVIAEITCCHTFTKEINHESAHSQ